MIRWTTPTLKCTIPNDLEFDYLILTLKQNDVCVEKRVEYSEVTDGVFNVTFTQKETSKFKVDSRNVMQIEAQLNIMNGTTRIATNIVKIEADKNLHDQLI